MGLLGKPAATVCAQNKITNQVELEAWLQDDANVQVVLETRNCGFGVVRQLFRAVGKLSPFDTRELPLESAAADLKERFELFATAAENRISMLEARLNKLVAGMGGEA